MSRSVRAEGREGGWFARARELKRTGRAIGLVWRSAPGWTALGTALIGVQSAVTLGSLYLLKLIVDAIAEGVGPEGTEGAGFERVMALIALAGGLALLGVVARSLGRFAAEAKGQLVTDHMLARLHEKSIAVDYGYYEDPRFYNTLHIAQQEAPVRPTQLLNHLTQVIQSGVTAVGVLVLLASVHWVLAGVIMVAVAPALLVQVTHSRRLYRWRRERSGAERRANYFSWLIGDSRHAKELRVFDLGREFVNRFRALRSELRGERLGLAKARDLADGGSQAIAALVVFGSLAFIGYRTFQGVLTLGDMVMYFGAVQRGQSLLQSLFSGLGRLYEDNLFLSNVEEFLEMEPTIRAPENPRPVPDRLRSGLRCEGVDFRYPTSSRPVLEHIHLEVAPGQVVAVVGPNGSGKTTLTKLLCRLYDPLGGSVTLDGVDLREFDPVELRRKFAFVFQDYAHYCVSVHDNVRFGNIRRPTSRDEIREAARAAGVDPAIGRLRHGYDTVLGRVFAEGEELSIGEWQKLAIARAFHSEAEILVVDEPTSALDAHAEVEVFQALLRLFRNRSAVVISHRLSTVRLASRIYFLDEGRIVEAGTHEDLMARGGRYARLFRLQAEPYQLRVPPAPTLSGRNAR